jgi:hypothetical protein
VRGEGSNEGKEKGKKTKNRAEETTRKDSLLINSELNRH